MDANGCSLKCPFHKFNLTYPLYFNALVDPLLIDKFHIFI